ADDIDAMTVVAMPVANAADSTCVAVPSGPVVAYVGTTGTKVVDTTTEGLAVATALPLTSVNVTAGIVDDSTDGSSGTMAVRPDPAETACTERYEVVVRAKSVGDILLIEFGRVE
ncbi:hypothetical protein LTR16_005860, partial [Cryomyces antarcticus]